MKIASNLNRKSNSAGFTLIEVMVALAILASLTVLTAQAMKTAVDNRARLSNEINRDALLADSLRVIRADVATAFNYRDTETQMWNDIVAPSPPPTPPGGVPGGVQAPPVAQPGTNGLGPPGQGAPAPLGSPRPSPSPVTGFIGESESMYFSALGNIRTMRDQKEGDQARIGYFVKSCRSLDAKAAASKCLFRSSSPYLFDENVDKDPGPASVLVENVEEFKLRYIGPGRDEYVETWKTGSRGDSITKDKFPYAVEITLTLKDKNKPKEVAITGTVLAPLMFPNNPTESPSASPSPGGGAPPQPPQPPQPKPH